MIAGTRDGKERGRNCRQSGWKQGHACASLAVEFAQGIFQRFGGRRAAPAIIVAGAVGDLIFRSGIEQGRGVIDRRIDKSVIGLRIAARRDQSRIGLDGGFWFFRHMIGTSFNN